MLESARAGRFIQKILNAEERNHPKIEWMLREAAVGAVDARPHPSGTTADAERSGTDPDADLVASPASPAPSELQVAATFLAGRYARLSPPPPKKHEGLF